MIRIERSDLNIMLQKHYDRVVGHKDKAPKRLLHKLTYLISHSDDLQRQFYKQLLQDVSLADGKSLITGTPEYLKEKIDYYESEFGEVLTESFKKHLLADCFFYSKYAQWGAYELAEDLKVTVCPYCNRQYTFTLQNASGKTRPQFDHFYDKATYPYLSLSFFNLIPSCHVCNSNLKGGKKFCISTHIHPFLEGFEGDGLFTIIPKSTDFINGRPKAYELEFKRSKTVSDDKWKRIENNIKDFQLKALYNIHKDYIDEIMVKNRIYSEEYMLALFKQFEGTLFSTLDEVKRTIYSNYLRSDEFGKRVLSKLTSDIANDLSLR